MTDDLRDQLARIVAALPSDDASVTLRRADLRRMLGEDVTPAAVQAAGDRLEDYTVEQAAEAVGRAPSTLRGWLGAGRVRGAYRLNGREWRIPRPALSAYMEAQSSGAVDATPDAGPVDLGSWRRHARDAA